MRYFLKEIPHNMDGSLAGEFQPSAACKFLDLPPGLASPFLLKTVQWTAFSKMGPVGPWRSTREAGDRAPQAPITPDPDQRHGEPSVNDTAAVFY